jgi:hypothetical protein
MARSFTFNGKTRLTPGAISRVTTNSLTGSGGTNGIVSLIGEADGGTPGEVLTFDDPDEAIEHFGSGPLADAARIVFDPSADPRVPGGAFRILCYKVNAATQASTTLPSEQVLLGTTLDGDCTSTVLNWTGAPVLAVDSRIGSWVMVNGEKRRIVSNTADSITVSQAFSTTPALNDNFYVLSNALEITSIDYGAHTNLIRAEVEPGDGDNTSVVTISYDESTEQSGDLGGNAVLEVMYLGGPVPDQGDTGPAAQDVVVTAATTSTVSATFVDAPEPNQYDGYVIEFESGLRRLIASHNTSTSAVFTLDGDTPLTAGEAVAVVGETMTIRAVTAATASIVGSGGVATGFETAITMEPVSVADDLDLDFLPDETLAAFITRVNAGGKYLLAAGEGINANTTLMKEMDFGTRATAVDVRFDHTIEYDDRGTFRADLQAVVDWINDNSSIVTCERHAVEGSELPAYTGGSASIVDDVATYLIGGTRGSSTNSDWQDGFDALLEVRHQHCAPLISYDLADDGLGSTATFASVAAQAASFADAANSGMNAGAGELGVYLGMDGTKTELLALTNVTNNPNVHVTGQKMTVLDPTGTLAEKPEWSAAANAAGMRAGMPDVGESLTFKKAKCVGISNDPSWRTKSDTDRNALVEGGVMFLEAAPNGGFRWVRDLTSYISDDDNNNYIDGAVRDATRYITYDLRSSVEERFTGEARAATVSSIRSFVSEKLDIYYKAGILVDSNDPEDPNSTTVIPGWRRLKVSIVGNTANIKAEVFVINSVVFEGIDISVQVPQLVG